MTIVIFCTLFNDKNQIVHFTFNGSEFVEKLRHLTIYRIMYRRKVKDKV